MKLDLQQKNLFKPFPGRLNIVTELNCGMILGKQTCQNDRFFLYTTLGYRFLNHCEKPLQAQPVQKVNEQLKLVLGDDLGVNRYLYSSVRFDWLNLPYVSDFGARVFNSAEIAYYPP